MAHGEGRGPVVLIVEDDDETRYLFSMLVRKKGFSPVEARNGVEALEAAESQRPAVIFMDLSMPEMDGITAARRLRQDESLKDIPIIFLTAHGEYGIRLFSQGGITDVGGPTEYLTKPVDLSALEAMLNIYSGG